MRWYRETGNVRIVRAFLWLPLTIHGEKRWLETATWEENHKWVSDPSKMMWVPVRWVSF